MKYSIRRWFLLAALAGLLAFDAGAQETPQPQDAAPAAAAAPLEVEQPAADQDVENPESSDDVEWAGNDEHIVINFGNDSYLGPTQKADAVISILGSSTSDGATREAVVSVLGDTRVTGPTGADVVAVFGNTYVNSRVGNQVVAVFGNVELGPQAEVFGDVIAIGGKVKRMEGSVIHGKIEGITMPGGNADGLKWLRPWIEQCLMYGRPLAPDPNLGWVWTLAFGFLGLYILIALLFAESVEKCAITLETRPGPSLVAALLTMLAVPAALVVLVITLIGIALVPFAAIALFVVGLFGKVVMLAAIGRRLTGFLGSGPITDVAFAVLIGGFVAMGLYMIPFLGFIIYKLLGILGMGVVAYTLILASKERRAAQAAEAPVVEPPSPSIVEPPPVVDSGVQPDPMMAASNTAALPADALLPRADFWIRMGALLIDVVVVSVALNFIHDSEELLLLPLAIYGAVMWKLKSTTLGGMVCHLKVVRLDGREMDWSTAAVRALGCFLSVAPAGLGFFWIAIDKGRQAWHDKIAGTIVVRVPRAVSLA